MKKLVSFIFLFVVISNSLFSENKGFYYQNGYLFINSSKITDLKKLDTVLMQNSINYLELENMIISSLPQIILNLKEIKTLVINNCYVTSDDVFYLRSFYNYTKLTGLFINNTNIRISDSAISIFKDLEELEIINSGFKKLPLDISKLKKLERVSLKSNKIKKIPESFFSLQNLKYLSLSNNLLDEIPQLITELKKLKSLDLSGNRIQVIPIGLVEMDSLYYLDISNNNFCEIPENFTELRNIKSLNISKNPNLDFDVMFKTMYKNNFKIISIGLAENRMNSFPSILLKFNSLIYLNLEGNNIKEIPDSIFMLNNLVELNLNYNNIQKIPPSLLKLKQIKYLTIASNELKIITPTISHLIKRSKSSIKFHFIYERNPIEERLINLKSNK